jgi:hypothetical protein
MLKPSFRFFIIPLGAICTLASMSAQNTAPRAPRDGGAMVVHQQVIDCSNKNPADVCVITYDGEASAR